MNVRQSLILIIPLLLLNGCSILSLGEKVDPLEVVTRAEDKPPLNLEFPPTLEPMPVKFYVVTQENVDSVWEKLSKDKISLDEVNKFTKRLFKKYENLEKADNNDNIFNKMIDDTIQNLPMLKNDTDTYKKVVDFIHRKKSVTKSDILDMLNWGVRISFSGYRNRLRNEPTIRFTKNRYEVI